MPDVLILGGGAVGLSTAHHLALRGAGRVTVLERDRVGAGASGRAAGIVTGQLWSATGVAVRRLSLQGFRRWSEALPGYRFADVGCLNLFHADGLAQRRRFYPIYAQYGVHHEELSSAAISQRWPALRLRPGVMGLFDVDGGYSEPDELLPALAAACRGQGVDLREGCRVTGLRHDGGRTVGVDTDAGPVEADVVVCCLHVWSRALLAQHGHRAPTKAFRHQRFLTRPPAAAPDLPAINAHPYGGYLRPAAGGAVLVGVETPEVAEVDVADPAFDMGSLQVDDAVRAAAHRVLGVAPEVARAQAARPWADERVGALCFSADGEPLLGRLADGSFVATAFHSGGFAYAPAAGRLLAEWIVDGRPSVDLSAFAPDRFDAVDIDDFLRRPMTQAAYHDATAIATPRKF